MHETQSIIGIRNDMQICIITCSAITRKAMCRILPLLLLFWSSVYLNAESDTTGWSYSHRLLESDRLFLDWYVGFFFYSPEDPALKALGFQLSEDSDVSSGPKSLERLRQHIAALPVRQQARLFLLTSLAIPIDGEKADMHWNYLFVDLQAEIKNLLLPIQKKAC